MKNLQDVSDSHLLHLCAQFGARALKWRRRFTGLLPEVARRRLFEKKGFNSIFEFAYKLAGLSEEQVRVALRLDLKFEDKPSLRGLLVGGEVSLSKLARVAGVATTENEEEWAQLACDLPRGALETLVRDQKMAQSEANIKSGADVSLEQKGLNKTLFEDKSVPGHGLNFEISEEVARELNHLNLQGHDVNKIILELLEQRRAKIAKKKEELAQVAIEQKEAKIAALKPGEKLKTSTYIAVKIKTVLKEEYGTKCSIPGCDKPAQEYHHSQRLSIAGLHDPRYIAPMCMEHHQIAHLVDLKYAELQRSETEGAHG